jgi:7-cyano-7-deazaguanine synthase
MSKKIGLVVLSGGQDSATCLAVARKECDEVFSITFDYGQKHKIEIYSAVNIARELDCPNEIIPLGDSILRSTSPLVSGARLDLYDGPNDLPNGIEQTFVPARNSLFLTIASNRAVWHNATQIYTGVCQEDYGGYPDCRHVFIVSMEAALNQGIGRDPWIKIETPLMFLTKGQIVQLGKQLLKDKFDKVMSLTHTCYAGVRGGCGYCHACILRDRGFSDAGIDDPLWKIRPTKKKELYELAD